MLSFAKYCSFPPAHPTPAPRQRAARIAALLAVGIISLLAFAGCELGSEAITAVTGQPDPNVLYAEYERNYNAYHLDWVDYQLALEQAQGEAAAAGRETALLAQELEQAAQALNINQVPIPGDTAGRISLAGLTLAKIKKADGIPEKSDELPSEGALGYIAEYGFAAIDAAAVGLIGAAVIGSNQIGVPPHFASVIVLAAAQVAKRSLEWILKELQHRDEAAEYFQRLNAELASESAKLRHVTARLEVVQAALNQRRVSVAEQRTALQFAMLRYRDYPTLVSEAQQAVTNAAVAVIQIPLANEPALRR